MKRMFIVTLLAAVFVVLFTGCQKADPNEAIIGHWECQDGTQEHIFLCTLIFDGDGRFTDRDGDEGTYIISGDMLHLDFDDYERNSMNFSISGRRLTIKQGNDVNIRLTKQ